MPPDGIVAHHTLTPEKPRQSRAAKIAAPADNNPDAALHEMIRRFRASRVEQRVEWDLLNHMPKRHPDYQPRMAALLSLRPEQERAEKQIVLTAAVTFAGAQAKAQLGYDILSDDDHQASGLLHEEHGSCRMWSVALAGTRDMVRLTGGLCGETWDSPDRTLLEAWTEFRNGMLVLQAHGTWKCGSWRKHPDVSELDGDMHLLRDRIICMPARTVQGRAAKAAVAVHILAEDFAEGADDGWAKKVIRAAEAGLGNAVIELPLPAATTPYEGDAA